MAGGDPLSAPETIGKRRVWRAVIAGASIVALAAIALAWRISRMPVLIQMQDAPTGGFFAPGRITVASGTTVQWKNVGEQPHDATDDPAKALRATDAGYPGGARPFDSGFLSQGQTFSYTFEVPGTYRYVCIPHEFGGMTGEVIVTR